MKFRCPCGEKEMNIADEKLPALGTMRFPCPVCRKTIVLDPAQAQNPARFEDEAPDAPVAQQETPLSSPSAAAPSGAGGATQTASPIDPSASPQATTPASVATLQHAPQSVSQPAPSSAPLKTSQDTPALEPEMIPHGMKAALVAISDQRWRQASAAFFRDHGFYLLEEADPAIAVQKLLINAVDVALVDGSATWQPVREEITRRPGLKRRETCLMVVGSARSMDSYAAFLQGADWMVSTEDVGRAGELLGEMLARQEAAREPWTLAETP